MKPDSQGICEMEYSLEQARIQIILDELNVTTVESALINEITPRLWIFVNSFVDELAKYLGKSMWRACKSPLFNEPNIIFILMKQDLSEYRSVRVSPSYTTA